MMIGSNRFGHSAIDIHPAPYRCCLAPLLRWVCSCLPRAYPGAGHFIVDGLPGMRQRTLYYAGRGAE